ncbi:MAG: AAC(3) family N-acetyltransferase [Gemmatimonadota bacterium]|nr:AAC(3) family N-acetyltransferase [Gemmatimonadota bacterium]
MNRPYPCSGYALEDHPTIHKSDLLHGFAALGLCDGDALFFHSSLRSFGYVEGGADTVIDGAVEAVGESGTVVVPTFVQKVNGESATYRTRLEAWNIGSSPSDVGHITEVFRRRPEAVRSDHCCDSLAAIGADAGSAMDGHRHAGPRFSPWDEKAFGHGSPWDWLVERNALYLLMGVGFNVCSIFHFNQALWVERIYADKGTSRMWPGFNFSVMGERVKSAGLVSQVCVGPSVWQAFRVIPTLEYVSRVLRDEPSLITLSPLKLYGE